MGPDPPALQVTLLGGLGLGDGGPRFRADQRYQLLAYLASQGDWVSRDRLADLFWPHAATETAKQNLRRLLVRVRALQWLRDLEVERARLRWRVDSDLARFLAAWRARDWAAAVAAYGGPFLQGLDGYDDSGFTSWLEIEREQLHASWREAAFAWADGCATERDFDRGTAILAQVLEQDGFDEDAMVLILELALRGADRRQALARYRAFVGRLRRELGLQPSASTEQLAKRLLTPEPAAPLVSTDDTAFVGRGAELAEIATLLSGPACRLLTLVGPGGIGKTRVALEAARRLAAGYPAGVAIASLEALSAAREIPTAIADALSLRLNGPDEPHEQVARFIGDGRMLLVLDNVEHLVEGASIVTDLLSRCPNLRLLLTSRERLRLAEERTLPLEGLAYPAADATFEESLTFDAVALFVERARRAKPAFAWGADDLPHLVEICRGVDGLPLGLELAAAWVRVMSCQDIARELHGDLDFLTSTARDVTDRRRSLRSVFDHSWRLLVQAEQRVLGSLAVFRGGFSLEAAKVVAGANAALLAALIEKSLVRVAAAGRYELHPLITQYARERLTKDPDALRAAEEAHGRYFLQLLSRVAARPGPRRTASLAQVEADGDNVAAAWSWAVKRGRHTEVQRAVGPFGILYDTRARYRDGLAVFQRAIDALGGGDRAEPTVLAHLLLARARLQHRLGAYDEAMATAQRSRDLLQRDRVDRAALIGCLATLGNTERSRGRFREAQGHYHEALRLAQSVGDMPDAVAPLWVNLGTVEADLGNLDAARHAYERGLALDLQIEDHHGAVVAYVNLGNLLYLMERFDEAESVLREGMHVATEIGARHALPYLWLNLGAVAAGQRRFGEAQEAYDHTLRLVRESGDRSSEAYALIAWGWAAIELGDTAPARLRLLQGLGLAWSIGLVPQVLKALVGLAAVQARDGDVEQVVTWIGIASLHEASQPETRALAQRLRDALSERLTPEQLAFAHAERPGASLEEVVAGILRA